MGLEVIDDPLNVRVRYAEVVPCFLRFGEHPLHSNPIPLYLAQNFNRGDFAGHPPPQDQLRPSAIDTFLTPEGFTQDLKLSGLERGEHPEDSGIRFIVKVSPHRGGGGDLRFRRGRGRFTDRLVENVLVIQELRYGLDPVPSERRKGFPVPAVLHDAIEDAPEFGHAPVAALGFLEGVDLVEHLSYRTGPDPFLRFCYFKIPGGFCCGDLNGVRQCAGEGAAITPRFFKEPVGFWCPSHPGEIDLCKILCRGFQVHPEEVPVHLRTNPICSTECRPSPLLGV